MLRIISLNNSNAIVPPSRYIQSFSARLVTLNISPPKVTMRYCPIKIIKVTNTNPLLLAMELNAVFPVMNALALNKFQNCSNTKIVKKRECSYRVSVPSPLKVK